MRAWVVAPSSSNPVTARVDDQGTGNYAVVLSPPLSSALPGRYEVNETKKKGRIINNNTYIYIRAKIKK